MTIYRRPDPIPRDLRPASQNPILIPVRNQREDLSKLTARSIFHAIDTGAWSRQDVLPKESEIEEELGVSRTVVREAIKYLASKAVVETIRRRGTSILPRSQWNIVDNDIIQWMREGRTGMEVDRMLLGALATILPSLATAAATKPGRADKLKGIAGAISRATDRESRWSYICNFHLAIAQLSGNPFLENLASKLVNGLSIGVAPAKHSLLNAEQYVRLAAAIDKGDQQLAYSVAIDQSGAQRRELVK